MIFGRHITIFARNKRVSVVSELNAILSYFVQKPLFVVETERLHGVVNGQRGGLVAEKFFLIILLQYTVIILNVTLSNFPNLFNESHPQTIEGQIRINYTAIFKP